MKLLSFSFLLLAVCFYATGSVLPHKKSPVLNAPAPGRAIVEGPTLTLQPGPEEAKCCIVADREGPRRHPWQTRYASQNSNPDISAAAWTFASQGLGSGINRTYFAFTGLSAVPAAAVILSAKLSLYGVAEGQATAGPQGNSTYPGSPFSEVETNACWLKRVTGPWSHTEITWVNKPPTTDEDRVAVPASDNRWTYNVVDLDVTRLVQKMVSEENYGFCLQLQEEQPYRNLSFGSPKSADPAIRPKLVVTYAGAADECPEDSLQAYY